MTTNSNSGIVTRKSAYSFDETVGRLEEALKSKGIDLFARIDHGAEAQRVGLRMPNTKLFIFGNPLAGTPIMLASPSAAIDLPLKILVSEEVAGEVWLSYNSAEYLQARHGFPRELAQNVAGVSGLVKIAGEK